MPSTITSIASFVLERLGAKPPSSPTFIAFFPNLFDKDKVLISTLSTGKMASQIKGGPYGYISNKILDKIGEKIPNNRRLVIYNLSTKLDNYRRDREEQYNAIVNKE